MKASWSSASDRAGQGPHLAVSTSGPAPIELHDVSLQFLTFRDKSYSMKRAFVELLLRREDPHRSSEFWAIRNLDLRIGRHERVGIIGHNGAGKSTLLRMLARIYTPTSGRMRVEGSVAPLIELGAGFNTELSGFENILLNGAMLGCSRKMMLGRADAILDFAGLRDFADVPLKYYSSGMNMRLAFTIATEIDPDILLIDEALGVGDAEFSGKAKGRMNELLSRSNTVVIVSHDMKALRDLCTRGLWMDHGRVVADGPIAEIIDQYQESVAARIAG